MTVRNHLLSAFAIAVLTTASVGCTGSGDPHAGLPSLSVAEVVTLIAKQAATVIDANSPSTREEYGVIPGALLLSNYGSFEATELPADKDGKLVFYCSNERCAAAPKAAMKAVDAGYTDVAVLPQGIKGWKEAGQETASAPSA